MICYSTITCFLGRGYRCGYCFRATHSTWDIPSAVKHSGPQVFQIHRGVKYWRGRSVRARLLLFVPSLRMSDDMPPRSPSPEEPWRGWPENCHNFDPVRDNAREIRGTFCECSDCPECFRPEVRDSAQFSSAHPHRFRLSVSPSTTPGGTVRHPLLIGRQSRPIANTLCQV